MNIYHGDAETRRKTRLLPLIPLMNADKSGTVPNLFILLGGFLFTSSLFLVVEFVLSFSLTIFSLIFLPLFLCVLCSSVFQGFGFWLNLGEGRA
jgi:hypothetical protein